MASDGFVNMHGAPQLSYALIETALGCIGVAWSEAGLVRLQLPERDRGATERRLLRSLSSARQCEPARESASAAGAIVDYCAGAAVDFSRIPVDLSGVDAFRQAIYTAARKLGYGETTTYGRLADAAGYPGKARETGVALGQNPVAIIIPCHRIVAANGKLGGFSANGGAATKARMLDMEGARLSPSAPEQMQLGF